MANPQEQNLANHSRVDPPFHYFVLPVFLFTFVGTIVREIRVHSWWRLWNIVMALAALLAVLLARSYAIRVQDRVIRLEERLRLGPMAAGLNEKQLIALRFASDEEAPALAEKARIEKLGPKQIKQAIRFWRPDHWRV